jgi:glycosyltransferase involved in cell wall biosynthesis
MLAQNGPGRLSISDSRCAFETLQRLVVLLFSRRELDNVSDLPLSVIVPAYNAEATIRECLERVYASTFQDFEVIVVDDRSSDGTAGIVRSFPCRLIHCAENLGPGNARNLGAARASGRILYFLDADVLVKPETIGNALDAFRSHPEYSAIFGSYDKTPRDNFVSDYKNLLHHYTHQTSSDEAATFCGGVGGIRRDAFFEVGGFDPKWRFMEDVELGGRLHRAGHRICLNRQLQSTHLKRYTLAALVRSDVMGRAIPWTRIMLDSRMIRNDLNTRIHNVASVPVSFALLAALVIPSLWRPLGLPAALAGLALLGLNRGFLGFVRRERGFVFLMGAMVMCWFGYLYSGAGAVIGWLAHIRDSVFGAVPAKSRPDVSARSDQG